MSRFECIFFRALLQVASFICPHCTSHHQIVSGGAAEPVLGNGAPFSVAPDPYAIYPPSEPRQNLILRDVEANLAPPSRLLLLCGHRAFS